MYVCMNIKNISKDIFLAKNRFGRHMYVYTTYNTIYNTIHIYNTRIFLFDLNL